MSASGRQRPVATRKSVVLAFSCDCPAEILPGWLHSLCPHGLVLGRAECLTCTGGSFIHTLEAKFLRVSAWSSQGEIFGIYKL